MALKYYLSKWHFLAIFFLVLIILSFIIPANASKTIGFQERYYDWEGYVHNFNGANLEARPLYVVVDNVDNWAIVRDNKTVYLPKRSWIEYKFYPERIVPIYKIDNFSQISGLVTKVNTSIWYLTVPFSSNYYVSVTDDLIDFGVFKRTTKVTATDSNTTVCGLLENISCPDYRVVPRVVNNDIRLYFNPQNFTNVVYPLYLTENTVTVDNATFWSTQDCGDGYWSAYGGGSCATPLNSSIHANLTGYWDMESTAGTTEYGIDRYGRFPNSTIAATWNGGASINSTSGQNWGNAALFNGLGDYLQIPDSDAFTIPAGSKATWSLIQYNNNSTSRDNTFFSKYGAAHEWIFAYASSNLYFWVYDDSFSGYRGRYSPAPSNKTFHKVQSTYNGGTLPTSISIYTDDVKSDTTNFTFNPFVSMRNTAETVKIASTSSGSPGWFNGSIDEVIKDASGNQILSNSTYSTSWSKSFLNNTASAGNIINAVKFNIYNLNVQNNTANISARETGNSTWTLINSSYVSDTWINQTFWNSTDFAVDVSGNGSSRAFIISMTYDETVPYIPPTPINLTYITDNSTWINHTWSPGSGYVTDSYNVSVNGVWTNGSVNTSYNNTGLSLCSWSNISVYAWNNSGTGHLNTTPASQNVQIACPYHIVTGYVTNYLGAFVDDALVQIDDVSTFSEDTYIVDNTDLCDFNHSTMRCDGTRTANVTYNASSEIELLVFSHANQTSQTAQIILNIDGTNVSYTSGRPLGGAETSYKELSVTIPKYTNYTLYFTNEHHYEWREYRKVHGYYSLTVHDGSQNVLVQQLDYDNFTSTINVTADMTYNISLVEKEEVSEDVVIDYSMIAAIVGGLLAFVLLRKRRKDDDYKYKGE